jgi:hypothetical protein
MVTVIKLLEKSPLADNQSEEYYYSLFETVKV